MNRIFLYGLYSILLLCLCNCSKDNTEPEFPYDDNQEKLSYKLQEDVIDLSEKQQSYILGSNNETLLLDATTPSNLLPQKGEIIFDNKISEKLPNGFCGRVSDIREANGKIEILTKPVPIPEIFSDLEAQETINLVDYVESFTDTEGNVIEAKDLIKQANSRIGGSLEFEINLPFTVTNPAENLSAKGKVSFTPKLVLDVSLFRKKEIKFSILSEIEFSSGIEINIKKGEIPTPFSFPIGHLEMKAIPWAVVLTPTIEVYLTFSAEGSISLSFNIKSSCNTNNTATYHLESGEWTKSQVHTEPKTTCTIPRLSFKGEAKQLIHFAAQLRLFGSKNAYLELSPFVGFKEESNAELPILPMYNGEAFSSLKKCKFTTSLALGTELSASSSFMGKECKVKVDALEFSIPIWKKPYYPAVENLEVEKKPETKKVEVKFTTSKPVVAEETKVGIGIYNKDEELIQTQYDDVPYTNTEDEEGKKEYSFEIENMSPEEEFTVRPLFNGYETEIAVDQKVKNEGSRLKRVIWSFKHDNQLEIRDFLYDKEGKLISCKYSGDLDNRLSLNYNKNTITILDSEDFYSADMTFDASGKILKGINLSYEAHPVDIATYNTSGCLVRINNSTINWANGSLVSVNDKNQGFATITSDVEYNPEIQKFNVALYNLLDDDDLIDYETDCFCFAAFMNKIGAMPKKLCSKIKREGCISRYSYEFNEVGVITKIVEINRWDDEDEDHIFTHEFIYE